MKFRYEKFSLIIEFTVHIVSPFYAAGGTADTPECFIFNAISWQQTSSPSRDSCSHTRDHSNDKCSKTKTNETKLK